MMTAKTKPRKKRTDRNHLIYEIRAGKLVYVGLTYVTDGNAAKSLRRRWQKHVRRALTENKNWRLCKAIRDYGPEAFDVTVIKIIRGKDAAHAFERDLIRTTNPCLNTDVR